MQKSLLEGSPQLKNAKIRTVVPPNKKMENPSVVYDVLIFHTPGHSPGSISLFHRNEVGTIFTGDTYSFTTRDGGHMTGFPRYGNNLEEQSDTLQLFRKMSSLLDYVAPGHGHVRNYIEFAKTNYLSTVQLFNLKQQDVDDALKDLKRITSP